MSRVTAKLDTWFPRTSGMRRLTRMSSAQRPIRVFIDKQAIDLGIYGLLLRKNGGGVTVFCNLTYIRRNPLVVPSFIRRPCTIIAHLAATDEEIRGCHAEFSDGWASGPGIVSQCSANPAAILIPDWEFFCSRGFAAFRQAAEGNNPPWRERDDAIVWRGSTTGTGRVFDAEMAPTNHELIQRSRLCLILRDVAGADAKFVSVIQTPHPAQAEQRMRAAGILGGRVAPVTWLNRKFAIDIDGNANTWSNFISRLLLGCCVIKVASPLGYRQWYYDDLVPWRHYVPVAADMSDLVEKIDWCRSNPSACEAIAAAGQSLAMAMTFDRETARGVATLNAALPRI